MWILNKMMVGCEKASYLVSKKSEGTLTMVETLQLKMHLLACKMCRHFEDQTHFMDQEISEYMQSEQEGHVCMREESKNKLKELLKP